MSNAQERVCASAHNGYAAPASRVVLVTGSVPPTPCGVGDYTARLASSLRSLGADAHIVSSRRWGVAQYAAIARQVRVLEPDVVHIQYPAVGYGTGLAPQLLSALHRPAPVVVTVHEFSQAHPLRRLAVLAFAARSAFLIFVSEAERTAFLKVASWVGKRSAVIPLASNIPFGKAERRDPSRVTFFGLIGPRKGLEEFLSAARIAHLSSAPFRFEVVGAPHPRHGAYARRLQEVHRGLPVVWTVSKGPEEVAAELAASTYAYLPFPDGASDRRGSLLAVMGNGAVVVTTAGAHTTVEMKEAVRCVSSAEAAVEALRQLAAHGGERRRLSEAAMQYAHRFSWGEVARRHLDLYHRLAGLGHAD